MLYRIKQFFWAIESFYKKVDMEFIERYLDDDEKKLFNLLSKSDRNHSIRVAKDLLEYVESFKETGVYTSKVRLVKIALLHDIGKIERPLNVFEKSIIVLLDKLTKAKINKYNKFEFIDIYYNHAEKGHDMLVRKGKYDAEFLNIIKEHHNTEYQGNKIFQLIKYFDNKN
ncbi:MAG: HDIG domain-containing metalloprotein [Clostridiaceae bacterium]